MFVTDSSLCLLIGCSDELDVSSAEDEDSDSDEEENAAQKRMLALRETIENPTSRSVRQSCIIPLYCVLSGP